MLNFYLLDAKNLSTIQESHLILAKLIVLESFDENQSYLLIKMVMIKLYKKINI